jgi:hypothetical protein
MPALLKAMSSRPNRPMVAEINAATAFASLMSVGITAAWRPSRAISAATARNSVSRRAANMTAAPLRAKASAAARPMPVPAPVTRAT